MLKTSTPKDWVNTALSNFDAFLLDHASCERKASAVGMSFIVRYPDRLKLIEPMIQFSREELEHFHQVYRLCEARGLMLAQDEEDEYVNLIMKAVRHGREERLLDRLIASAVIEARGHERLGMVAEALTDPSLHAFYTRLTRSEGRHRDFFIEMARQYFAEELVQERLEFFLEVEAKAIESVPHRCALH